MIIELHTLSTSQEKDITALMAELVPGKEISSSILHNLVKSESSHLFAIVGDNNHIVGCATLCIYDSPTGRKASVEDVVVTSCFRGRGFGKMIMEHVIEYAKRESHDVDLHLTSNPHRVAANELYQSLGFEKRETNSYVMMIRENDG